MSGAGRLLAALLLAIAAMLAGCASAEVEEPPFDAMSGPRFVRIAPGEVAAAGAAVETPLWVMTTEVTRSEWQAFGGAETLGGDLCGDSCPVTAMTWGEAAAHANARSEALGIAACYDLSGCAEQQVTLPLVPGQSLRRREALVCTESVAARPACAGFRLPTRAEWQYLARAGGAHELWACAGDGCEARGAAAVEAWSMEQQAATGGLWLPYPAGWFWEPNGFDLRGFSDNASEWVEAEAVRALGERCGDSYMPRGASGSLACDRLPVSGFSATTGLRLVRRAD